LAGANHECEGNDHTYRKDGVTHEISSLRRYNAQESNSLRSELLGFEISQIPDQAMAGGEPYLFHWQRYAFNQGIFVVG
jgi:hypothetical protein